MTNKKFNLTKGGWLIILCFGIILFGVTNSQAIPIPMDIDVTNIRAEEPSVGTGYLTQYWLETAEFGELDAFCVEKTPADSSADYALVYVPGNLFQAAIFASRYYDGSVLALGGINQTQAKVATQLAIWNNLSIIGTITDPFYSPLVSDILNLAVVDPSKLGSIYLAQSPRVGGSSTQSQDYLVSVPDAGIMWLLGPAFIMLGLLGRKKAKVYLL